MIITRRDFIGRSIKLMQQQCVSSLKRIMSFRWLYPALLLLSLALLGRTLKFASSSLPPRQESAVPKFNACANFSDPLKLERDMLGMSMPGTDAAEHHYPALPEGDRYMWYAPHDGFDKQVLQLVNALKIAMLLNRTLIVPPILEEGEVVLGDCLDSQLTPRKLRQLSWSAVAERIADSRYSYVSIADIIDLRTVSPQWIRTIDMRVFLALWCDVDVSSACSAEGEICRNLASSIYPWKELESCSARFLPTRRSCLVREVEESCKTTIWTNTENRASRSLWEQILETKILERYGQDSQSSSDEQSDDHYIRRRSVVESLGPGTAANQQPLLCFGSLSSQPFDKLSLVADIRPAPGNDMMAQAFAAIEALPYTEEIMQATRSILELSGLTSRPFLCAHLGLGSARHAQEEDLHEEDEEEAERILTALRSRLEKLVEEERSKSEGDKVNLFVMTDLSSEVWSEKYLRDIADNRTYYEIYTVDGYEDILLDTAHKTMTHEYGLWSGYVPLHAAASSAALDDRQEQQYWDSGSRKVELPPDIRGGVEQVLCSCATLGFYGTSPSAVSSRIISLRRARLCPTLTTPQATAVDSSSSSP